ncbi:MAG: TrbC/VirB2 family protein [Alphaproteobacteria bacterium]
MNSILLKNTKFNIKLVVYLCLVVGLFAFWTFAPDIAKANATPPETNDAISQTLCNVILKLTGPIGKGIATIAIIVLGVGLFLGKMSWAVAVATAIGIGLIFGAGSMVEWIGKGATSTVGTSAGSTSTLTCS